MHAQILLHLVCFHSGVCSCAGSRWESSPWRLLQVEGLVSMCVARSVVHSLGLAPVLGDDPGPAFASSPLSSHRSLSAHILITFLADAVLMTLWEYLSLYVFQYFLCSVCGILSCRHRDRPYAGRSVFHSYFLFNCFTVSSLLYSLGLFPCFLFSLTKLSISYCWTDFCTLRVSSSWLYRPLFQCVVRFD